MTRLPVVLCWVAAALAGCADGSTVDDDPLTKTLGTAATTVERIVETTTEKPRAVPVVDEVNAIAENLLQGHIDRVDMSRLHYHVQHPSVAYRPAHKQVARFKESARRMRSARIASSDVANSSGEIKGLVRAWNAYVDAATEVVGAVAKGFTDVLVLQASGTTFLRASENAIRHGDEAALQEARQRYITALKAAPVLDAQSGAAAVTRRAGSDEQAAFDRLVKSANASGQTKDFVATLIRRYPESVFGKRFQR